MRQKGTFKLILAGAAIMLVLLPPFAALNSIMTEFLDRSSWYRPIQKFVVPWEARLVSATIYPLGIRSRITSGSRVSAFYMVKEGSLLPVNLAWNCLGWQSGLLLIVSLVAGLRGQYTFWSRLKCVLFGLLGTVLVNILRMSFIAAGIYYVNSFFGMIVHDYFAAFITIAWLAVFWWFSYAYILDYGLRDR